MSLQSKEFQIQGCNWKDVKHFSLYLMVADSFRAYLWDRTTHFKLTLINQVDGNKSVVKAYLEKAEKVKNLKNSVVDLEIELRMLRTKLVVAEVVLDIARKGLEKVEKSFKERDINAELGYGT
ncbi:hypothetical protein TanjilG_05178 [Lupinus angustifolius]|uniref:Uncharacterized protein n=1 Tax=Lupinus angustifolius TaxID=3871 RepID=A0A394DE97_LUPAN|nr:hypothetical protein TanjilG_05178 [Lupinus angustifolius]